MKISSNHKMYCYFWPFFVGECYLNCSRVDRAGFFRVTPNGTLVPRAMCRPRHSVQRTKSQSCLQTTNVPAYLSHYLIRLLAQHGGKWLQLMIFVPISDAILDRATNRSDLVWQQYSILLCKVDQATKTGDLFMQI